MAEAWHLRGEYFENCNCEVTCACVVNPVGRGQVVPNSADGSCHVIVAYRIDEGHYEGTDLAGLNAVFVLNTPPGQPMALGYESITQYLDVRASDKQWAALEAICTGKAGGVFARFSQATIEIKTAAIRYESQGNLRSIRIDGVGDVTVEIVPGQVGHSEPVSLNSVNRYHDTHPLWQAVGRGGSYRNHGMEWDNTGKNSYVSPIDLKGP